LYYLRSGGGVPKTILEGGTGASYSPTGHVVFARAGALLAAPFDARRLELVGAPFTTPVVVSRSRLGDRLATSISPDGTLLAFTQDSPETGSDVWTLSLATKEKQRVLGTRFNEVAVVCSPDGGLLAFVSDETGRNEVYADRQHLRV
jgi:hypothetical protein